jgi:hypothetical protein
MLIHDSTAQTVNHVKEKHNEIAWWKARQTLYKENKLQSSY